MNGSIKNITKANFKMETLMEQQFVEVDQLISELLIELQFLLPRHQ